MPHPLHRRSLLAAAAAAGLVPRRALAAEELVAATFGGTWAAVQKQVLAPYFTKRTGATVVQSPMLATEQIAKLTAAKGGQAPFDVAMLDEGPALEAIDAGLIAPYDVAKSPNLRRSRRPVPRPLWAGDHHADHRHRLQSEADHHATHRLGRSVEVGIQGPRRHHLARQHARPGLSARHQPPRGRRRNQHGSRLQEARDRCCPTSRPSRRISAPMARCSSRARSTSACRTSTLPRT